MLKRFGLVVIVLTLLLVVPTASAQDPLGDLGRGLLGAFRQFLGLQSNVSAVESNNPYVDIPQTRTEDGAFILGDPAAPITIVLFEDFLCPHCQTYQQTVKRVMVEYVFRGKARLEYRMVPVVNLTLSTLSAQLAECADVLRPGTFWQAHDLLFELASAERFSTNTANRFAQAIGIPIESLMRCVDTADQVKIDGDMARKVGVQGTPAVMVRYGNGPVEWIVIEGRTYDRGGPSFAVLETVILSAQ